MVTGPWTDRWGCALYDAAHFDPNPVLNERRLGHVGDTRMSSHHINPHSRLSAAARLARRASIAASKAEAAKALQQTEATDILVAACEELAL